MAENILSLNHDELLSFLMQSEQYKTFELPEYFNFDAILQFVQKKIGERDYKACLGKSTPESLSGVNYDILTNKDGKYAIRPMSLVNPYLYYFLSREICSKRNWSAIISCFKDFMVPTIFCCSIPVIPDQKEAFYKSTVILNWWNSMEQQSIELSLEYRYMFVTDITNCYGSINPQTLDWALSKKDTTKSIDSNHELAEHIMGFLRSMQQGRNVGIPQGSALFDILAEIILGYADLQLYESLHKKGIEDYKILRYRDDYRIYCNNKDTLEVISYELQHILEKLNFRMNSSKTQISESIVTDSVKPDKLFYIFNTPIFNKKGVDFDGIQKHLFYILMFARKYPNGGQLKNMLSDLDKRIFKKLEKKVVVYSLEDDKKIQEVTYQKAQLHENITAMVAIATQIAIENVGIVHYALRIISRMIESMDDDSVKIELKEKVCARLKNQPNASYSLLWLQNMTYVDDAKNHSCPYDLSLCKVVMQQETELWDNSWLREELKNGFPVDSICSEEFLKKVTPIITFRETRAYYETASMNYSENYLEDSDYELIATL